MCQPTNPIIIKLTPVPLAGKSRTRLNDRTTLFDKVVTAGSHARCRTAIARGQIGGLTAVQ